ncbi:MAG TPA: hypothetical protein VG815_04825 [Chloroflexota bacterium]|nr:hypothetical protein [Chloroflexota bacterium]
MSLFSEAAVAQNHALPAGTVTLTNNVTGGCSVANVLPGASPSSCTLQATYSGSAHAYLGLDILIETQAGNGLTNLYNPGDSSHDLQVAITSTTPTVTYTVPTVSTTCPGAAPSGSTCYEMDKELVSTTPFSSSSATVIFTAALSLPTGTTTGYRGGAAQIYLTAHATQSSNNPLGACTAGASCSTMQWS